jgi:hypothetical protein
MFSAGKQGNKLLTFKITFFYSSSVFSKEMCTFAVHFGGVLQANFALIVELTGNCEIFPVELCVYFL